MTLVGGRVLVTGATGGIGHAIARAFAARGAELTLTGRKLDVLEPLADELKARSLACDLSDREQVARLAADALEWRADVLIANAALPASGLLTELTLEQIDRILEVNLRAPIALADALAPQMIERGQGHMVFVSSLSGKVAAPSSSMYSGTKFGLRGFALGLREDLRPHGVGVSTILPGFISGAGMFADAGVKLPFGVGTRTPEQVATAAITAIERNRAEVDVAPLSMRLGAAFAGFAPQIAATFSRLGGSERIAAEMTAGQIDKRCSPMPDIVALFGPTGVGKTDVAIALADRLRAQGEDPVAVSADALQVYAGLERLTGAATPAERARLEHRLISFLPVDATFSAGQYAELAHAEIDELLSCGRRPIVVGGTGLYLRAALTELSLRPPPPEGAREHWTAELQLHGPEALHATLASRAPWAAAEIAPTDRQRLVRALELLDAGELEPRDGESELWTTTVRRPTQLVGLVIEREQLYARIDARVDQMIAAGAEREVRGAHTAGASITARKALGFEDLLAGDIDGMKRRTRNYARRQLTWMRKLAGVNVIDATDRKPDQVADEIIHRLNEIPV